ncbi:SRPBCC family protein [Sphingobacterium paucimobilis]|uniref:Polyketide cyclase n=1 Tax=Sphingobacterium paucimobilis HER1398 TaxID=1346330 RepID=U2J3S6_9SPHI|nr:SRPBCC family protein [Sphingobacterium paucimobilis]ERJ59574.1 hypothetical protein M472_12410 [Sphingobacterium paucimobilis HER1398]
MKFIKYFLFTVLGLIAIILLVAAILPKNFHAGSTIVINKPSTEVFDYIKQIKKQGTYDSWSQQDPQIQKEYSGTDGTVGFTYTWKSKKVGDGKQVITKIEEGKRVDMDLFFNGSDQANKSFIQVDSLSPNQSEVHWEINGKMPYPFNLMSIFYDMSKDFDKGLATLKTILEK